jgi:hypothetical protein
VGAKTAALKARSGAGSSGNYTAPHGVFLLRRPLSWAGKGQTFPNDEVAQRTFAA